MTESEWAPSNNLGLQYNHMKIRFSLTRFDLFKARMAVLMSSRPLQILVLLIAAFCGFSGFTAESVTRASVGFRNIFAGVQIMFVLDYHQI